VKPAIYGGLLSLEPLVKEIESAGTQVVFTSSLECEPGRRALIAFLGLREREAAGISVGFLFEKNFLPDSPRWSELPATSAEELAWLNGLEWKDCRC
jgi:hypothetical protein